MATTLTLVTGAGRGIGRELAVGLASLGHDLALLGRTSSHLERTHELVLAARRGVRCAHAIADVTNPAAVARGVADLRATLGIPDLLINNAGQVEKAELPFAADDPDDMWRVIEVNVRGPLLVSHAVLQGMLERGSGRIVNINSGAGFRSLPTYTGYGVSKGALSRLTTLLDSQYRGLGVRTFDLAPGVVRTDMTAGMPTHEGRADWTLAAASVALAAAVATGELDALSGRLLHAGVDTIASLTAHAQQIVSSDARALRLRGYDESDPIA